MAFSNPTNSVWRDEKGQWFTRALFLEMCQSNPEHIKYTLKDEEFKGHPSLKQRYFSYNHIPGYEHEFATKELGGWQHWQRLCVSQIKPYIEQWREEYEIMLKANAMRNIISNTSSDGAVGLQACKYLADRGYKGSARGRPSKEEKERLAKAENKMDKEIEADLKRVGLKAVK